MTRLIIMSGLGGVSNATILSAINAGAQAAADSKSDITWALLFLISLLLHQDPDLHFDQSTVEIEAIIHKLRIRLMDHVGVRSLLPLEIDRARAGSSPPSPGTPRTLAGKQPICSPSRRRAWFSSFFSSASTSPSCRWLAFVMSIVIVGGAAVLFHFKRRARGGEARGGRVGEPAVRSCDRLPRRLQGSAAQPRAERRLCSTISSRCREPPPRSRIRDRRAKPSSGWCMSQISMPIVARRRRVRRAVFSDFGGAPSTQTTTALLFVVGNMHSAWCKRYRSCPANAAADNIERLETSALRLPAVAAGRANQAAEAVRHDRDAQYRVPLRRQVFRHHLPDRPARLHVAFRRAGVHHRRQRFGQIDVFAGVRRAISPISAKSRSTACASPTRRATPIAR